MKPEKTTPQFLAEARAKHGDVYDYSQVTYTGSHRSVTLSCPTHGVFERAARDFLKGRGCPACAPRQPMTTERFVARAQKLYGGAYDYSKSVCNAVKDKVCVTCPVDGHGDWWPKANNHLNGKAGCPKCAGNQRLGADLFLSKARDVHGDIYTYGEITYENNATHVEIHCKEHGAFWQSPMGHLAGQGCPKCAGKGVITTETFIALSKSIHGDKFDYSLAVFKTTADKITLKCKTGGHVFEQGYCTHIRQKSGCPVCAGNAKKTTDQFILDARTVHGDTYDYSLVEYAGKAEPVRILCKTHGEFLQAPNSHLNGAGCLKCYRARRTVENDVYIARASAAHNRKYTYEKTEYTGAANNVIVTCPEHGSWSVNATTHLSRGTGCAKCACVALLSTPEFIVKATALHGDAYDYSKVAYVDYNTKVLITCKKHGTYLQTPDSHLQGKGCSLCANIGPSKPQIEINDFLAQYTPTIMEHKFEGSAKRYDIYLPEKNIAIEYNGLYWHSSRTQARSTKEVEKYALAMQNGVRTITVFQDEWHFQPDTVKNTLLSAIGLLPRIFARKCTVQKMETDDVRHFYMDNHIQTVPNSSVHFGLTHAGVIVACMSFGMLRSSRRNTDPRHWELTRYASTHTVVGGASKLLAAFRALGVADKLTSYSDVRMFSGNMYAKLGFTRTHQTPPDYYYINTSENNWRMHKAKFQKKHLVKMFPGCDIENKTEREICEENGYYQVYDCGKVRWDLAL